MDLDDLVPKEDLKASRAANERARREDLPKLRAAIRTIENLTKDVEPE